MPREKSRSSIFSKKKSKNQLKTVNQEQLEVGDNTIDQEKVTNELEDTLTPLRKSIKNENKKDATKATTSNTNPSLPPPHKKSHSKSLSAPNFIKLETITNDKDLVKNETLIANDLTNSNLISINESSKSLIDNSNSNSSNSALASPLIISNNRNPAILETNLKNSSRSNIKFHQLFPSVPLSETVVDTYSCAYVKSLNLLHGVMFLTRNYICFYSKILTSENIIILKLKHINSITKTMHALIFPTAIRIETNNSSYSFTSFRSRSHTLDHLTTLLNQWRQKEMDLSSYKSLPNEDHFLRLSTNDDDDDSLIKKPLSIASDLVDTVIVTKLNKNDSKNQSIMNNECNQSDITTNNDLNTNSDESKSVEFYLSRSNSLNSDKLVSNESKNNHQNHHHHHRKSNHAISNHNYYNDPNKYIYHFDYSNLSQNKVTVGLRHKHTLLEKVKILISQLIPGFFEISRIDSLLPICFLMCVLLLLNAFVLLNKVNHVDLMFSDLLLQEEF